MMIECVDGIGSRNSVLDINSCTVLAQHRKIFKGNQLTMTSRARATYWLETCKERSPNELP